MKLSLLHIVFATVLCIGVNGIPTTETSAKIVKNGEQIYFLFCSFCNFFSTCRKELGLAWN